MEERSPPTPLARADSDEEDVDLDQIVERLAWSPRERLQYLLDMLAFEERAYRAKRQEG